MTTPQSGYEFKVNGEQFASERPQLTALEILTIAKQGGAIPNNPRRVRSQRRKGRISGKRHRQLG